MFLWWWHYLLISSCSYLMNESSARAHGEKSGGIVEKIIHSLARSLPRASHRTFSHRRTDGLIQPPMSKLWYSYRTYHIRTTIKSLAEFVHRAFQEEISNNPKNGLTTLAHGRTQRRRAKTSDHERLHPRDACSFFNIREPRMNE